MKHAHSEGTIGARHGRRVPAAVVEHEWHVEREVDGDADHAEPDGGAQAGGQVEVDEVAQQRAALLVLRHVELELEQDQHVGAHLEVRQRVRRARVAPLLRADDDGGRGGEQQGHGEEERRRGGGAFVGGHLHTLGGGGGEEQQVMRYWDASSSMVYMGSQMPRIYRQSCELRCMREVARTPDIFSFRPLSALASCVMCVHKTGTAAKQ